MRVRVRARVCVCVCVCPTSGMTMQTLQLISDGPEHFHSFDLENCVCEAIFSVN